MKAVYSYNFNRQDAFFISFILFIALITRIIYLNDYLNTDVYPVLPDSDGYPYFLWAKDIASGDLWGNQAFMKWPLYAYFTGFWFKLIGENISFIYILQFILGTVNCAFIYLIARLIFNPKIALISALLCLWYGLFIFYEGLLIYTSLSIFLNSLLFLCFLFIQGHINKKNIFLLGLLLGICTLAQANIVIFGILAMLWILFTNKFSWRKFICHFTIFLFALSLVIGVVTLRNYFVEKDIVMLTGNTGINFYLGNNPQANGVFHSPAYLTPSQEGMFRDAKIIAKIEKGKDLKTSQVSNFWFNKSADFIKKNPGAYLRLLLKKILWLFSPKEPIHDHEYSLIIDQIKIFKIMSLDLRFILPFCFLGLFINLKRFRETALIYIFLISISFGMLIFFVTTRYRIPMVPFMAIFASSTIFYILQEIRARKYLQFGFLCLALILIFCLVDYNIFAKGQSTQINDDYLRYHYHWAKAMNYNRKLDYNGAMRELKEAARIYPNRHHLEFAFGTVYYSMNDFKMAEDKFKEAIRIFPYYADAYYNLGLLYNQQGRFEEAKDVLEKAAFLEPEDMGVHFELGKSYKAQGDLKKARREFSLSLKKINRWRVKEKAMLEEELADLEK